MKISILLPDLGGGGAERLHVHLALDWRRRGHTVEFVLMRRAGELLALLPPGVPVRELAVGRTRRVVAGLAGYLRTARPDILVAAMWPLTLAAVSAHQLARGRGRVVVSEHSPLSLAPEGHGWSRRALLRASLALGYRLADARVAVSAGVADDLARLGGLPRSSIDVIYNPAAGSCSASAEATVDPWDGRPGKRVLTVGSLKAVKNHALLLRAFARLRQRVSARLVILGEGALRAELEGLVRELGLGDAVQLPGFALDPCPWYLHADLFVLSSDYEGFGNVLVEAMECGLPVVSTDCEAGPREILDHGRYGRLVRPGDIDALAAGMREALEEPRQPERQRRRAAEFSIERASQAYLDLFSRVLSCHAR